MKIYGLGTDIVNIKRIDNSLKKYGLVFKNKIFSKKEISYCEKKKNPSAFYAKRFAAKEAFSKAIGTGIRKGLSLKDIEISNNLYGKPTIVLKKNLVKFLKKRIKSNNYDIHLSLADDKPWAQATVIISYNK
ncbi:holo-ACP synthase [Pelagibacteraceae bacterium]|jgi:holo-[acyl-carrier protein] synthase|nr:holo-ACP synthase [Pelagibacteraceae bacterium]